MPSRLSSLLVRDGLVGIKRIEKAFQRQVVYGGSLDTILLEMNLVPEDRLTQYLSLAFGVPPASRDEGSNIAAEALRAMTADIAEQFRAVPVTVEGDALRILVYSPLEISDLEDLADLLDRPLQPLITPEYRWHLAFAAAYRRDPPARFTTLARTLEIENGAAPVGRARSVIVELKLNDDSAAPAKLPQDTPPPATALPSPPATALPPPPATATTPPPATATTPPSATALPSPSATATAPPPATAPPSPPATAPPSPPATTLPPPPATVKPAIPVESTYLTQRMQAAALDPSRPEPVVEEPSRSFRATSQGFAITARLPGTPRKVDREPAAAAEPAIENPPLSSGVPIASRPRARASQPIITTGRDSPLAVIRARELLITAEDRDSVFLTLLRATRSRARYAALLTIQGGAAIGRVALAEPGIDTSAISNVLIPLDVVSPFRSVANNQQPHIGPLSGDPSMSGMLLRFGGSLPPSALILPIVLRERVVAVVVAHRSQSDLKLVDVAELLPLAAATADALGRLIVKHKSDGAGERSDTIAPEQRETARFAVPQLANAAPRGGDATPSADNAAPSNGEAVRFSNNVNPLPGNAAVTDDKAAPLRTAEPPPPIDQLLNEIESAKEGEAEAALRQAADRAEETLRALVRRFPGKLRADRLAMAGRSLRAAQYGGLLELTVRLGPLASELLIEKMSAPERDVRFFATVCALEQRPRNAATALVERLFDQDAGVRAAAIEALSAYPRHERSQSLARARRAVHSTDPQIVANAAAAIVALSDTESIGDLIGSLERGDRSSGHVRKALTALTAQDFGTSEKKWRKWWATARRKHRVAWLIEGLSHRDDAIRATAIQDLRRLTGEYFGYHHDLPRKEREAAAERWAVWWRDVGMRRFGITEPG